jgi:hypothetical protein
MTTYKPTPRKPVKRAITVELHNHEADAIAQLIKRITWRELDVLSTGTAEHAAMDTGLTALREALAHAGFDPR